MPDVFTITKKDGTTYTLNWSFRAPRYDLGGRDRTQVLRREGRATFKHRGDKANTPEPYVLEGTLWTDDRTTAGYNALRSEAKDIRDAVRSARSLTRVNKAGRWVFDDIIGGPKPVFTQASRFEVECTIELWPVIERDADFTAAEDITDFAARPYPGPGTYSGPQEPADTGDGLNDPTNPTVSGSIASTDMGGAQEVHVVGDYAYVTASTADSLTIVDISDPTNPTITGTISDGTNLNGANGLFVSGDYAYVCAAFSDQLTIVDVSNKASPSVVGSVSSGTILDAISSVHVVGDNAFVVSAFADRFAVIDVSNKSSPSITTSITAASLDNPRGVFVDGDYAYVAVRTSDALTIVDISTPSSPSIAGTVTATSLNGAWDVFKAGDYAYVACYDGNALTVVNVSDPTSPSVVGTNSTTASGELGGPRSVHAEGDYAYVGAQSADRMTVVNVATPSSSEIVASLADSSINSPAGIYVLSNVVYLTSFDTHELVVIQ